MGRDYWSWRSGAKPSNTHSPPSCITAVFHLFHSHRFHCPLKRQTSTCFKPTIAAAEPPSNCLDSASKEDGILSTSMGIPIKTNVGGPNYDTPGTKTPTLVARLMGLDLLPETNSPSFRGGTRSLPVTPRPSSDVDPHHRRLSLQIYKENMSAADELIMSRLSLLIKRKELRREYDTVKQRVTRKVGMNITNHARNREELVGHFKHKKISRALTKVADNSSSKLSESKSNTVLISPTTNYQPFSSSPRIQKQTSHRLHAFEGEQGEQHKQQQPKAARKCKKVSDKKLEIIRNKKEEPFVHRCTANRVNIPDKKCRKTPLSKDLLDGKVPTLVLVKKIPQKQVLEAQRRKRGSSSSTQTYIKQQPRQAQLSGDKENSHRCNYAISTAGDEAECEYIARILRRTGLDKETQVSISSLFSPSHPLDPSIFHYLERFATSSSNDNDKNHETKCGQLSHRCNRMLMFHLVDEVLSEILKPCFNMKPWVNKHGFSYMDGSRLMDKLCSRIRSFPRSDCPVLEDIDALIGRDTPEVHLRSVMAYKEQGEGIAGEIEKDMLEALVYELVVEFGGPV